MGSGGARTAWVYDEWNKNATGLDRGNHGYPSIEPETYRQMVRLFNQAGVSVGTHAIGDHAIDWVVDTYAAVLKEKPTTGLRHSIITPTFQPIMPSAPWLLSRKPTTQATLSRSPASPGGSATPTPVTSAPSVPRA